MVTVLFGNKSKNFTLRNSSCDLINVVKFMTEERKVDNLGVDSSFSNLYTGLTKTEETSETILQNLCCHRFLNLNLSPSLLNRLVSHLKVLLILEQY